MLPSFDWEQRPGDSSTVFDTVQTFFFMFEVKDNLPAAIVLCSKVQNLRGSTASSTSGGPTSSLQGNRRARTSVQRSQTNRKRKHMYRMAVDHSSGCLVSACFGFSASRRGGSFTTPAVLIVSSCQREMIRGLRGSQIWGLV